MNAPLDSEKYIRVITTVHSLITWDEIVLRYVLPQTNIFVHLMGFVGTYQKQLVQQQYVN